MQSLQDIWFEKTSAEKDASTKEAAAPKAMPQATDVINSVKPTLVVAINENDSMFKPFVERLDKVLSSLSGLERLQIKGFHALKHKNALDQLKMPAGGIALFKGKKLLGTLGIKAMENDIRKFIEANRKNFV
jgi:hypothetical protein